MDISNINVLHKIKCISLLLFFSSKITYGEYDKDGTLNIEIDILTNI